MPVVWGILSLLLAACGDDGNSMQALPAITAGTPGFVPVAGTGAAGTPALPAGCAVGQTSCAGLCTDLQSDNNNCGMCGKSCGGGSCIAGRCACPSTLTDCATGCVDTANDVMNCGLCGRACAVGELCQQGQCLPPEAICTPACAPGQMCVNKVCQCPMPTMLCGGACVDTSMTPAHCGGCDMACDPGELCQGSACVCPPGQTTCDEQCTDLQLNPQHCGMCGHACAEGEACMAGGCRAPLGADGCGGAPRDLRIDEVAAFQTVKVPLSDGVTLVDPNTRSALVQDRPTLFRVYVTPGTGFAAREFSARVTLKNGANEDQYFAKQRITKASTEADTSSTFQILVPRERIQADTRYSVELVECGAGSTNPTGGAGAPAAGSGGSGAAGSSTPGTRFPAQGDTPLAARNTGVLRITLVPLRANSRVPDTSEEKLAIYRDYMQAMYPVREVVFTVAQPFDVAYPVNWSRVLEQLRAERQRAQIAREEYYFGLLAPTATFAQFCGRGCTAGIAYIGSTSQTGTRVGLGLAYADEMSAGIMAHEIGHTHGRPHAPCAPGNQIQGVDSRYPYEGARTGVWAYDFRTKRFLDPANTRDIMSYCDPKWISDYTYDALLERSATLNPQMLVHVDPATIQAYRVVLLDASGPQWSIPFPRPDEPFGTPELAQVLDAAGQPLEQVTVYRTEIAEGGGFTILVPPPQFGWSAIELHDAAPLSFSAKVAIPTLR